LAQTTALTRCGVCGRPSADEPETAIDSKHCSDSQIGLFDGLLLAVRIALARRRNQAGIGDLTRHGNVTGLSQHGIELLGQSFDRPRRSQLFPEQPDWAG
jgi:hypothetical protein